ncbi:MAG TPA: Mur ligase domain-containing protein, partial [Kofleriaceae bacterium]|nr:Mur ligase domain-containing protein [Kofleriaceae bacterium]
MKLAELIQDLPGARVVGPAEAQAAEIGAVRDDSRAVQPGDLFVAVRGRRSDGHDFAAQAAARGAAALVVERELPVASPQVLVTDAAEALAGLPQRARALAEHEAHLARLAEVV